MLQVALWKPKFPWSAITAFHHLTYSGNGNGWGRSTHWIAFWYFKLTKSMAFLVIFFPFVHWINR